MALIITIIDPDDPIKSNSLRDSHLDYWDFTTRFHKWMSELHKNEAGKEQRDLKREVKRLRSITQDLLNEKIALEDSQESTGKGKS